MTNPHSDLTQKKHLDLSLSALARCEMSSVVECESAIPERLYHFTCSHSKRQIGTGNCLLIPQIRHPLLGCKVTWLTSEAQPDRESTGLGNNTGLAPCDRMEFRYVVTELSRCRSWLTSQERALAPAQVVTDLESYSDPEHWWIASDPVPARFDRSWKSPPFVTNRQRYSNAWVLS